MMSESEMLTRKEFQELHPITGVEAWMAEAAIAAAITAHESDLSIMVTTE